MIRDFFAKIISFRKTPQGTVLVFLGEEYVPKKFVENIIDRNLILEAALKKRIMAMNIMDSRLKQNKDLIERMHNALEAQNKQMHKQMDLINEQRQQIRHIKQIDWRMNKLKMEQKKIKEFAGGEF